MGSTFGYGLGATLPAAAPAPAVLAKPASSAFPHLPNTVLGKLGLADAQDVRGMGDDSGTTFFEGVYGLLAIASSGVCFYHGYKRNDGSIGWGLGWALLGSTLPVIAPALAYAQGLGQPAKKG